MKRKEVISRPDPLLRPIKLPVTAAQSIGGRRRGRYVICKSDGKGGSVFNDDVEYAGKIKVHLVDGGNRLVSPENLIVVGYFD